MDNTSALVGSNKRPCQYAKSSSFLLHMAEVREQWLVGLAYKSFPLEAFQNLVGGRLFVQLRQALKALHGLIPAHFQKGKINLLLH